MPNTDDDHSPANEHGGSGGPTIAGDPASFPSDAEYTRTLVESQKRAALSTLTESGHPFGSTVSYAVDAGGSPVVLISEMAEHTMNARRDPRSSMLIAEPVGPEDDPLGAARATLVGSLEVVDDTDIRERYLELHPGAKYYVDFTDFSFWALRVERIRYVGGFGHMSWVEGPGYGDAVADPISTVANGIIEHMNDDHADANLMYAKVLAGLDDAVSANMTGVDRYGFTLVVSTEAGPRMARVPFPEVLVGPDEVRPAVIERLTEARRIAAESAS